MIFHKLSSNIFLALQQFYLLGCKAKAMERILVTGANGLLGQKLVKLLSEDESIQFLATGTGPLRLKNPQIPYSCMDITNKEEVERVINEFKPTALIHPAAMTHVDQCETNPELCWKTNVDAVRYIAECCEKNNIFLVHLSTDFIFDGEAGPYSEDAEPNPLSVYGRSKAASEEIVKNMKTPYAILRTVLVYGYTEGLSRSNIVLWARNALKEGRELRVVNDQWRTPILAEDLAWACLQTVKQRATGIFHVSGAETYGIHEMVRKIAEFYGIENPPIREVSSEELGQPAKRPPRTGFIIDKARRVLNFKPRTLLEGLELIETQIREDFDGQF